MNKLAHYFLGFLLVTLLWTTHLAAAMADFTQVAKQAIPAVVSVKVEIQNPMMGRGNVQFEDPMNFQDELLRRFFRMPNSEAQIKPQLGYGSGFIVSKDGVIITNHHIVKNADKIFVTLHNGREYQAQVLGKDPDSDIAVIKIDATNLPILRLGNSEEIEIAQPVAAIGNPAGLQATFTQGVISAIDRSDLGLAKYENFIQTDAAINLGNSGGPLLDLNGEVVGVNTAIAAHTAGYDGIGFAIPSAIAKHALEHLLKDGSVTHSYLGIRQQKVDHDIAEALNLKDVSGVLIAGVEENSPAEKAKLQAGDVILQVNKTPIQNTGTFRNMIAMMAPGTSVQLLVKRDQKELPVTVVVEAYPDQTKGKPSATQDGLGIQVGSTSPSSNEKGVIISKIQKGSLAEMTGLKPGIIILSVNNQPVNAPDEFNKIVKNRDPQRPILLLIKHDGVTHFISLKSY